MAYTITRNLGVLVKASNGFRSVLGADATISPTQASEGATT